jgi:RNA polymerase sigma-70 factor, ECF subfamily
MALAASSQPWWWSKVDHYGASPRVDAGDDAAFDQDLIQSVLSGDTGKYAILVRRYQVGLYRYALAMVLDSDVAADLVQDTFVKAYANLSRCRDQSKFGTWVFQILRNRCLDHLKERRRKDIPLDDHHDIPATEPGPEWELERRVLRDVLDRALANLPEAQREAFILKHVHDFTYEEMAEIAGASVSALRMRVLRARELLQSLLCDQVGATDR